MNMKMKSALACGYVMVALCVAIIPARASSSAEETGYQQFAKMLWLFRHPRCANCHGLTDPVTGTNHEMGAIEGASVKASGELNDNTICFDCHKADSTLFRDENGEDGYTKVKPHMRWRLPPAEMRWAKKDNLALCEQISEWATSQGGVSVGQHLRNDALINWAFEGRRADAVDPADAAPPGMSKDQFIALFREWYDDDAKCDPPAEWTGTITVQHINRWERSKDFSGGGNAIREENKSNADWRIELHVTSDTTATARVSGTGTAKYVRTDLNPGSGCGFGVINRNESSKYHSPEKKLKIRFAPQPGRPSGYVIRFTNPPYVIDQQTITERIKPTCDWLKEGTESSTLTLDMKDQTNHTQIIGEAIELQGVDGKAIGWVMKGEQVHAFGDDKVRVTWDLAKRTRVQ